MTNGQAARGGPGLYLDLRVLPPTPQRLFEIIDLAGRCGFVRLAVDWGASFPWSLDERFRAAHAYPEEVVAGLGRRAALLGMELIQVAPAPGCLDFVHRLPGFRHLFRADGEMVELDLAAAGGLKLYQDLVEELLELPPGSREVALAPPASELLAEWLEELSGRGVRVEPLHLERIPPGASFGAVTSRRRAGLPFLCLQGAPGGSPLRRSIELSLDLLAASSPAAADAARTRATLDRLLERADRAWTEVRAIREALANRELSGGEAAAGLSARLSRLTEVLREAEERARAFEAMLGGRVEPGPLEAALGSTIAPITEELHLLIPRVQLAERRANLTEAP